MQKSQPSATSSTRRSHQSGPGKGKSAGGREKLSHAAAAGAELSIASVLGQIRVVQDDMESARADGSWAAVSSMHRMVRALEIDLTAAKRAEVARNAAIQAERMAGTDSATLAEEIAAALRALPEVERERIIAAATGSTALRVVG